MQVQWFQKHKNHEFYAGFIDWGDGTPAEHDKEPFELGSGNNYSINEIADFFGGDKMYLPQRKGEYDKTLCDYSKAKRYLGYQPKGNLKTYVKQWLEENK